MMKFISKSKAKIVAYVAAVALTTLAIVQPTMAQSSITDAGVDFTSFVADITVELGTVAGLCIAGALGLLVVLAGYKFIRSMFG